jgi:hypothetical protein
VHDVPGAATEHNLTNDPPDAASYARASTDVNALPPSDGSTHDITADPSPDTPTTPDGTPGTLATAAGVTATRALNGPHPTAFRARTAT